jgi:hypothetical protein
MRRPFLFYHASMIVIPRCSRHCRRSLRIFGCDAPAAKDDCSGCYSSRLGSLAPRGDEGRCRTAHDSCKRAQNLQRRRDASAVASPLRAAKTPKSSCERTVWIPPRQKVQLASSQSNRRKSLRHRAFTPISAGLVLDLGRQRRYIARTFRQAVSFASRNGLPGPISF